MTFIKLGILLIIITLFIPVTVKLFQIHPNENVYFNSLIGGLSGAKTNNFPSWGNTFGAAYRQGIVWLNRNAEEGAKIAFARELLPNIPSIWVRSDLTLHNAFRSGFLKQGEYIIGLTYQGVENTAYFDRYLERFLIPVYEVQVDHTSVLKVWKNDLEHTKPELVNDVLLQDFKLSSTKNGLLFDLGKDVKLSKIEANFDQKNCSKLKEGIARISKNGSDWDKLPGKMPKEDWNVPAYGDQPEEDHFMIPFAADRARFVEILISPSNACLFSLKNVKVFFFK